MDFDDFIKLWTSVPADFDGSYGVQCMDLMHFYIYLCLEITDKKVLSASGAKQAYALNYPEYFKKIDNKKDNFPVKGDIIFWKYGTYGHVAIVTKADVNKFESFEANNPIGSYPKIVKHSDYTDVLGWFHPITKTKLQLMEENKDKYKKRWEDLKKELKETQDNWSKCKKALDKLEIDLTAQKKLTKNAEKDLEIANQEIKRLTNLFAEDAVENETNIDKVNIIKKIIVDGYLKVKKLIGEILNERSI